MIKHLAGEDFLQRDMTEDNTKLLDLLNGGMQKIQLQSDGEIDDFRCRLQAWKAQWSTSSCQNWLEVTLIASMDSWPQVERFNAAVRQTMNSSKGQGVCEKVFDATCACLKWACRGAVTASQAKAVSSLVKDLRSASRSKRWAYGS